MVAPPASTMLFFWSTIVSISRFTKENVFVFTDQAMMIRMVPIRRSTKLLVFLALYQEIVHCPSAIPMAAIPRFSQTFLLFAIGAAPLPGYLKRNVHDGLIYNEKDVQERAWCWLDHVYQSGEG